MMDNIYVLGVIYVFAAFGFAMFLSQAFALIFLSGNIKNIKATLVLKPKDKSTDLSYALEKCKHIKAIYFPGITVLLDGEITEERQLQLALCRLDSREKDENKPYDY